MTFMLFVLLALAVLLIAYLTYRLVRIEQRQRAQRDTIRSEITRSLDAFEDSLVTELSHTTVPQRMMEHLRTTLANQSEQFVAFDERFAHDPKDVRFLGSPIDLVVFSGRSKGTVEEVVFVEIKQHDKVALTKPEQSLKAAIEQGNVRWERFDLAPGSGVSRERIRELGAEDLEADVSRTVRERTRTARQDLADRLAKHL